MGWVGIGGGVWVGCGSRHLCVIGGWGTGGGAIAWCMVTNSVRNLLGSRRAWSYKLNNCINENMDLFNIKY